tara:strand:- start:372 stop:902 length:531 start_codon:yes stop_codon:yes gene_type:complete
MKYKLIKENFDRATENLIREMLDDYSDFKAEYTDLKFEDGSVEHHILEAVKMVMEGQNSEKIVAGLKAALATLANDTGYLNVDELDENVLSEQDQDMLVLMDLSTYDKMLSSLSKLSARIQEMQDRVDKHDARLLRGLGIVPENFLGWVKMLTELLQKSSKISKADLVGADVPPNL